MSKVVLTIPSGEKIHDGYRFGEWITQAEYDDWLFRSPRTSGDKQLDIDSLTTIKKRKDGKVIKLLPSAAKDGPVRLPVWSSFIMKGFKSGSLSEKKMRAVAIKKDRSNPVQYDRVIVDAGSVYQLWRADDDRLAGSPVRNKKNGDTSPKSSVRSGKKPNINESKQPSNQIDQTTADQYKDKEVNLESNSTKEPLSPSYAMTWNGQSLVLMQGQSNGVAPICSTIEYSKMTRFISSDNTPEVSMMSLSGRILSLDGESYAVNVPEKIIMGRYGAEIYFTTIGGEGIHLSCVI